MNVQVEKKDHNMAVLTIELDEDKFDKACNQAYLKMRGRINMPGFRKGKAPRKMIEKLYGAEIFFEEAFNIALPDAYQEALDQIEEKVVSRPVIDITQIEAGKPVIFTAEVALRPPVTLGDYKGIEVDPIEVKVTDEEVDAEINREREANARMIDIDDRPVEMGDLIRLDYEGTIGGEPFEGGQGKDYPLTIGSGSFIPGFEEQLIGTAIGEDKDVVVTFPDDYHAEELRGKVAVFACKVNSIQKKELPEVDDEFAQDVSDFDTLAEYKEDIRKNLTAKKEEEAKHRKENAVVEKIIENAEMDIPDMMIESQAEDLVRDFGQRLQMQGLKLEQYLQYTGMTMPQMVDQYKDQAKKRIQGRLVLEAIAKAEGLEATEEDLENEYKKMAEQYSMEVEKVKEYMGSQEDGVKEDLATQKALDLLVAEAK